jgi:hypothetical protein
VSEYLGEPTYKESKTRKNDIQGGRAKTETTVETWYYIYNNWGYCVDITDGVAGNINILKRK